MRIVRFGLRRATELGLLFALSWVNAGGIVPIRDSVTFESGQSVVAPGSRVQVRFLANQYMYGSSEYAYVSLAVVPDKELLTPSASRVESWSIIGLLASTPGRNSGLEDNASPYYVEFDAPTTPGDYMLVMGGIPTFVQSPLPSGGGFKRSFIPYGKDRGDLAAAIRRYNGAIIPVAKFSVSGSAPAADETPTLYLRLNGTQPNLAKGVGGLQDKPATFSWEVGKEFKKDRSKLQYRYRMQPDDDTWGVWTGSTEADYSFLLKGVHQFQVQARYIDGATQVESQPASYQFTLVQDHISKPQLKQPFGVPPASADQVSFKEVYGKSHALLVGMWSFDDQQHFPKFDESKISADIMAMDTALRKNGFEVVTVKKAKVSRDDIVEALSALVASAKLNDRLFVYFSTHGFADPGNPGDGYLATSDCSFEKPAVRCLRLRELDVFAEKALNSQNAKQMLIAVDSCFSGLGVVRKSVVTNLINLSQLAVPKGAFMLTAGMATQPAEIDPALGMSTFTHFLADGLSGRADLMGNKGLMTLTQLFVYVQWKVAEQTKSKQIPMMGRIFGDGEMLFWPAKN